MADQTDHQVHLLRPQLPVWVFCERRGDKKNGGHHYGNAEAHYHPVIQKALKSRIYTHFTLLFTVHLQWAATWLRRFGYVKLKQFLFMKSFKKISFVYSIVIIAPLFSAYQGPAEPENEDRASVSFVYAAHTANEKYVIDTKESVVKWKCSMVFANKGGHNGYVSLSKGELLVKKSQLVGGAVEVDMNTIADERHGSDNNLINHLKDPDFFDVQKFPTSTFAITRVAPADGGNINVTGNLTIKGITREVTFPAKVEVNGRTVTANGKVSIDRTQWDVRYRSGKFFADLADEAISDNIEFDMKIVAKK
ncbi:YceI family protein [Fulvivirgaceae bacterium PWU4]|uniref:YceI family protein n=1 Tax=Chryseosolibacter histidini TaxID=2782349 RepID=A0AAP2DTD5_9BACT|nr:YceI family protein [Chryseosolibacter histidini]MBT1700862.1 YceI family protein [Chryseosolibacter histidini]